MQSPSSYFPSNAVAILAHRGFAKTGVAENTIAAFQAALDAGATHIETDVQATRDGIVVLFHDNTLERIYSDGRRVRDLTWAELQTLSAKTYPVTSLADALERFPTAKFNIDVKTRDAIGPLCQVLARNDVSGRLLVSSFSSARRRRALQALERSGIKVCTSADGALVLKLWLCAKFGWYGRFLKLAANVDALQIPTKMSFFRFDSSRFLNFVRRSGIQLHFWTVNDVHEIKRLVSLGANGIVTDRTDLAREAISAF